MRRAVPLLFVLVALVGAGAGAAGCGGGGDDQPTGTTSSKGDYVAQVQEASGRVQQALAEISDQGGGEATAVFYGRALDRSVAALDRAVFELERDPPPAATKAAHDLLVEEGCRASWPTCSGRGGRRAAKDDPAALAKARRSVWRATGRRRSAWRRRSEGAGPVGRAVLGGLRLAALSVITYICTS